MFDPALRAGRCRRARRGGELAALLGLAAAALLGSTTPAAAEPGADAWYRLRVCESGNNYRINTGNGFYGAYQFTAGTWHAYGGAGLPSSASPAEQDLRAKMLYRASGWSPWPACSRRLGLGSDPKYGRTAATVVERPTRRAAPAPAPAAAPKVARPAPVRVRVRVGVRHHPVVVLAPRPARARPVVHRPPRLTVWSVPDGGRWGRSVAPLHSGTASQARPVHLPAAAFGYLPAWTGDVRPL